MIDVWELMRWLMDGVEVMAVLIKVRVSNNFLCLRTLLVMGESAVAALIGEYFCSP
jgi:hypothetical protein